MESQPLWEIVAEVGMMFLHWRCKKNCPLSVKHLEDYTKIKWTRWLSTESITEDKLWGFLFYKSNWAKGKQGGRLKASEKIFSTRKFYTKDCAALIRRNMTVTTALVENWNRSQFLSYSQINQYLCTWLKMLKKKINAGQSVISTE